MKIHHVKAHGESLVYSEYRCDNCGEFFERRDSRIRHDENMFCSRECNNNFVEQVELECEYCGSVFSKPPSIAKNRKYCSRSCTNKAKLEADYTGEDHHFWKDNKVVLDCEQCGSQYQEYNYRESRSRYCSKDCFYEGHGEEFSGENHPRYTGYGGYYGSDWNEQREKVLERDNHRCRACGMTQEQHKQRYSKSLEVHHVVPLRKFDDPIDANSLGNLVTACMGCHRKYEGLPVFPQSERRL